MSIRPVIAGKLCMELTSNSGSASGKGRTPRWSMSGAMLVGEAERLVRGQFGHIHLRLLQGA